MADVDLAGDLWVLLRPCEEHLEFEDDVVDVFFDLGGAVGDGEVDDDDV
ncbi:hypothetical protein [Streptomyces sp. NPDC057460]